MSEMITFQSGKNRLEAYLSLPTGTGPFPGVVVIHEIFGLNENIKDIADRFAKEGYAALAVDLFSGKHRVLCILQTMTDLLFKKPETSSGVQDLKEALSYLAGLPSVDPQRLGAIGFCMGGSYAIAWGCADERLKVIAPFYGMNPHPLESVKRTCPVVASYPEKDITRKAGQKLEAALEYFKIPHDVKFYQEAKHSFFNDKGTNFDPEAARDSWERVKNFFKEYLDNSGSLRN